MPTASPQVFRRLLRGLSAASVDGPRVRAAGHVRGRDESALRGVKVFMAFFEGATFEKNLAPAVTREIMPEFFKGLEELAGEANRMSVGETRREVWKRQVKSE